MGNESGGSAGRSGHLAIYDYETLRDAVMGDSPDAVNGLVMTWWRIAEALTGIASNFGPVIDEARGSYATPRSAPAFFDALHGLRGRIQSLALDLHRNASAMNFADLALRGAQRDMAALEGDGTRKLVDLRTGKDVRAAQAGVIAHKLNEAYAGALDSMVIPGEVSRRRDRPPPPLADQPPSSAAVVTAPAPSQSRWAGSPSAGRDTTTRYSGSRGTAAIPLPPRGPAGSGDGSLHRNDPASRVDRAARRVQVPGLRGGGPLGGPRIPASRGGTLGATETGAPPGGSKVQPHTGRTAVPPGGAAGDSGGGTMPPHGGPPGQGGGRRGRRLTRYERIENEFVDTRVANRPGGLIGSERMQPQPIDPEPGLIGSQGRKSAAELSPESRESPDPSLRRQGFPDRVETGSFVRKDGMRFEVRRRGSAV